MNDAVKKYQERRDARVRARKEREDDQWITMRGTHVLIDDGGQVSKGPEKLKNVVKQGGGYKSKAERKYGSNDKFNKFMNNGWNTSNRNVPAGEYKDTTSAEEQSVARQSRQHERRKNLEAVESERQARMENSNRGLAIDSAFDKVMKGGWEKAAYSASAKDPAPGLTKAIGGVKKGQEISWGRGEKTEKARRKQDGSWEIYDRESGEWYSDLGTGEKLTSRDVAKHMLTTLGPMKEQNAHMSLGVTVSNSSQTSKGASAVSKQSTPTKVHAGGEKGGVTSNPQYNGAPQSYKDALETAYKRLAKTVDGLPEGRSLEILTDQGTLRLTKGGDGTFTEHGIQPTGTGSTYQMTPRQVTRKKALREARYVLNTQQAMVLSANGEKIFDVHDYTGKLTPEQKKSGR